MNKAIARRWCKELRSGNWKQGQGALKDAAGNVCCLGVLCEMAVAEGVIKPPVQGNGGYWDYGLAGERMTLPSEVRHWAGMDTHTGVYLPPRGRTLLRELSVDNDKIIVRDGRPRHSFNFKSIANKIEKYVDAL